MRAVLVWTSTREVAALIAGIPEINQSRSLGSTGSAMCGYATQERVAVVVS